MASLARSSKRSRPVRSNRTQVQSYNEDSGSDNNPADDTESDGERARRQSHSLRPRNSTRNRVSYREDSTDDSPEESSSDDAEAVVPVESQTHFQYPFSESVAKGTAQRLASRLRRSRNVKTRSQTQKSRKTSEKKQLELAKPRTKRKKVEKEEDPVFVGSGVIPPWQTLPYQVLFDIFTYASHPLVDGKNITRNATIQWIVNVALLCRSFHEPALAALYHSPPLVPAAKAHGLLALLSKPQESLSTNYVSKIRELDVDVETLLLYKSGPTLGYFELPRLIEKTPLVKRIRLYHHDDFVIGLPPWQIVRSKWTYNDEVFNAIKSNSIRLHSWDWNSRFKETSNILPLSLGKHLHPSFHGLRELRLLHVASEYFDGDELADISNEREVVLASAIKELPDLRRLEFIECSIVNEHLLPNLPHTLTSLTITNCDEVTTGNFIAFLNSHGQHLRELNLSHNRHLSLSFIVGLAQSCQQLERFKMDLSMHDYSSYHDVEPHYAELLKSSEVPTWPSTLQEVELIQMRKWDGTTAEVFFTSLIEAAAELRDLRRLVISAILKIGWRDRASFREKWIGRLEKVFLRQSPPPDPTLRSIPRPSDAADNVKPAEDGHADDTLTQSDAQNSGPSTPSKRKSARLAQRKVSEIEDNVEAGSPNRGANQSDDDNDGLTIQGMCDVVMVRIDNQRPTETQFNEEDFLDDELSGDEDWNGNDLDMAAGGHAW